MSALQAAVVIQAVLVDGFTDLAADFATDGAAHQATEGGTCETAKDGSCGACKGAERDTQLGAAQCTRCTAGSSCDSADSTAGVATAIAGFQSRGLALGTGEHGNLLENMRGEETGNRDRKTNLRPKSKSPGCVNTRGWRGLQMTELRNKKVENSDQDGIKPGKLNSSCRALWALNRCQRADGGQVTGVICD